MKNSPVQDRAEPGQRRGVRVLGRAAIADDQARPVGARARGPEAVQPQKGQAVLAGPGDELALDVGLGKFEDRVQAGRDPGDVPPLAVQGGGQAVAAAAVGEPGAADLPAAVIPFLDAPSLEPPPPIGP